MDRRKEINAIVKEAITQALFQLMEKKQIEDITISELVEAAGVGRVTFYRNYQSKKEVVSEHIKKLILELGKSVNDFQNPSEFSEATFRHFYKYKDTYLLLYKQNMHYLIYEAVRNSLISEGAENVVERYMCSTLAGVLFGTVDEWMRRGMQESPDEIVSLCNIYTAANNVKE